MQHRAPLRWVGFSHSGKMAQKNFTKKVARQVSMLNARYVRII